MPSVRNVLVAAAIIAVAAVGGFAVARTASTDGPDPGVDEPVVVRPAEGSNDDQRDDKSRKPKDRGGPGSGGSSGGNSQKPRDKNRDDRSDDRRDDHGGQSDDDLKPARPTPGTIDDDDDDDRGDDDGDDDRGDDERGDDGDD